MVAFNFITLLEEYIISVSCKGINKFVNRCTTETARARHVLAYLKTFLL